MRVLKHHTFVHNEELPPLETIISAHEIIVYEERKLSVWFWVQG